MHDVAKSSRYKQDIGLGARRVPKIRHLEKFTSVCLAVTTREICSFSLRDSLNTISRINLPSCNATRRLELSIPLTRGAQKSRTKAAMQLGVSAAVNENSELRVAEPGR
jgi:hypothetical protein